MRRPSAAAPFVVSYSAWVAADAAGVAIFIFVILFSFIFVYLLFIFLDTYFYIL